MTRTPKSRPADRLYLPTDVSLSRLLRMAYALSSSNVKPEYAKDFRAGALPESTAEEVLAQMKDTVGSNVLFRAGRIHGRDVMLTVFRDQERPGEFFVNPHWLGHLDSRQDDLLNYLGIPKEDILRARAAPRTDQPSGEPE